MAIPHLSIIIVTQNSGDLIFDCLSSIYKNIQDVDFEVILIDNKSTDCTLEKIKGFLKIDIIENSKNLGFSRACNKGFKASKGDFILLLNPDVMIDSNFRVSSLIDYMKTNERIGVMGCKLINKDGSTQSSCRKFPDIFSIMARRIKYFQKFRYFREILKSYLNPVEDYSRVQKVDWILGAFLLVKREVINKVGFFDERFFLYFEDVDFCKRVGLEGYDVCYYPFTEVLHHHKRDSAKGFNKILLFHIWSGIKYFWKWKWKGYYSVKKI